MLLVLEIENKGTFEFTILRIQRKTNILAKMSNFSLYQARSF